MNQEKIGKFISDCRKEKNLTQEQLAIKLGTTSKSISRWENGKTMPDYSIIKCLCEELDININELFAGEHIKDSELEKQFEKNILNIFKFNNDKRKKYKIVLSLISIILCILIYFVGKDILIKNGYIINPELRYVKRYELGKDDLKGEVNYDYFESKSIDFEIGANKYGYAVFKNPDKALERLKKDYNKGLKAIQKEFSLLPINNFNFREYGIYGWQLTKGTEEEKSQAKFVSNFFDIYENSFN